MFTAYRIPQLELAILQGLIDTYVYHIGQHSSREFLLSFHLKKKKKNVSMQELSKASFYRGEQNILPATCEMYSYLEATVLHIIKPK